MKTAALKRWWGDFALAEGRWAHFQIGPLSLFARRVPAEWRFAWKSSTDALDERAEHELDIADEPDFAGFSLGRFALRDPGESLRIMPRLAERAVVVRAETPLHLPPQEETTLFVSTPLWITLASTGRSHRALTEIPSIRPSETWFGQNTREGESCYASKTNARTDVAQLANVAYRAITPIVIRNEGADNLSIQQLRVPVTNLALYVADDERMWTDTVRFERQAGESVAALRISEENDDRYVTKSRIAEPRQVHDANRLVQAFSRLFQ